MSDLSKIVDDLEQAPVPSVDVPVLLDAQAAARHRELEAELHRAQQQPGQGISERSPGVIAQAIADLYETARPTVFRFVPLKPREWADLIAEHPPGKGERADVNPETFWPQAMAACCIEPEGATADEFARMRDSGRISNGQWNQLITGCRQANEGTLDVTPSSAASRLLRASALRSATAPPEASQGPSS